MLTLQDESAEIIVNYLIMDVVSFLVHGYVELCFQFPNKNAFQ